MKKPRSWAGLDWTLFRKLFRPSKSGYSDSNFSLSAKADNCASECTPERSRHKRSPLLFSGSQEISSQRTMEEFGVIFWSIGAMPIGLAITFGPAMLVWYLTGGKEYLAQRARANRK
jgi:hypothetical protein